MKKKGTDAHKEKRKPHTPTWATDALIGHEEHNGKKEKEKRKRNRKRTHVHISIWTQTYFWSLEKF